MEHTWIRPTVTHPKDNLSEQWGSCNWPLQLAMSSMYFTFTYRLPRHGWKILVQHFECYCFHLDTLLADLSSSPTPQAACLSRSPRHPPVFVPLLGRTPHPCICCDGTSTVRQLTGGTGEEHEGLQNDVNENGRINFLTRSFWMAFRDSKACQREAMKAPQIDVPSVQRVRIHSESLHLLIRGKESNMQQEKSSKIQKGISNSWFWTCFNMTHHK